VAGSMTIFWAIKVLHKCASQIRSYLQGEVYTIQAFNATAPDDLRIYFARRT
jgi:hypothetical protein